MKPAATSLVTALSGLSGPLTLFLALLLAILIGLLNLFSGYNFHQSALYVVPVCWVAWQLGVRAALFLAAGCVFIYAVAGRMVRPSHVPEFGIFWNAVMLMIILLGMIHLVDLLSTAIKSLTEEHTLLKTMNKRLEDRVLQGLVLLRAETAERERLQREALSTNHHLDEQKKLAIFVERMAIFAHRMQNLMAVIKGQLHMLEQYPHTAPRTLQSLNTFTDRLSSTFMTIDDFFGRSGFELQAIPLKLLIQEVAEWVAKDFERRKLNLVFGPCDDHQVRCCMRHLRKVLYHILCNAAEASENHSRVTLRTRRSRSLLGGTECETVVIDIIDEGRGIPAESRGRLFEPFCTTKPTHVGLGLALSALAVELNGGLIEYKPNQYSGSTFSVFLPRETVKISKTEPSETPKPADRSYGAF